MKKLIRGIVEFRSKVQEGYREAFGRLAIGQAPDALFVACSDSRVVPNTFASTDPGDLFVCRNVGNLIPPADNKGISICDCSEASAVEFSVSTLRVSDIIICGHSECGAMKALLDGRSRLTAPNLKNWLRHGDPALERLASGKILDPQLSKHNQLSQLNVLQQMENIVTYPEVRKRVDEGSLAIHGWWFDIARADVYAYVPEENRFTLIDETEAERLMARAKK